MTRLPVNIAFDVTQKGTRVHLGPAMIFTGDLLNAQPPPTPAEGSKIEALVNGRWVSATVERNGESAVIDGMPARGAGLVPLAFDDYDESIGCSPWRPLKRSP